MANLEWYRSFVEVYRIGTVSKAAEALHLTQPAVSQHIAALEATLGIALFQRLPRRMLPTSAGKSLYTRVVGAIETLESVPHKTNLINHPFQIRLGTPPEFFSEYLLPRITCNSGTQLRVEFGLVQHLIDGLVADRLDCAIATQKLPRPELEYQRIFTENFWLVGPPAAPIPSDPNSLESWLLGQPWIAYDEDLPIIRRFWRSVFGHRLNCQPQLVNPDLRIIRQAIGQGIGYSVLPDYLCQPWIADGRLNLILQPEKAVTNDLWLAYRKSQRQSQQVTIIFKWLGRSE
jgi:DNA-binding transcriptional LysR family regulator